MAEKATLPLQFQPGEEEAESRERPALHLSWAFSPFLSNLIDLLCKWAHWGHCKVMVGGTDSQAQRAPISSLKKNIQDLAPAVMQKIRIRKHSPWAMVGKSSLSIPLPSFCTRCSSLDPHTQPFGCLARTTPPAHQPCSPEWHMQHGAGRLSPRPPSWPTEVLHPISPTHPGISLIPDNLSQQSSLPAVE